jgi:Ni/Fe-hydrogenase subunit HybB-like protein
MIGVKSSSYKWHAVAAFPIIGIVSALIVSPHSNSFSWPVWIAELVMFSGAAVLSALGIWHTKQLLGKFSLILLFAFYMSFLVAILWGVVSHATLH